MSSGWDQLSSYVPASVLETVATEPASMTQIPYCKSWDTCALFADVSGYTRLCEAMSAKGPEGDEHLAKHLNSYFELLVRTLSSNGGDVYKFAGDAVLALWPVSSEDLPTKIRRAAQCGLEIQQKLQEVKLSDDITLSVTVGIGAGTVSVVHVGGMHNRLEYIPVGEPLVQAFRAEAAATPPDVVMSPEAWAMIDEYFEAKEMRKSGDMVRIIKCLQPVRKVSVFKTVKAASKYASDPAVVESLRRFIPSAVMPFVHQKNEKWASELRRITVLFVNLGIGDRLIRMKTHDDMLAIHQVVSKVQQAVYKYEGSLNKFLMDDKGSTLVAAFGLPPLAHEDDAVRGVLSSLAICAQLHELGIAPSIGITTGTAFCGVVGSRGRREYTVLGDTVNLSARLMQAATKAEGGVFCDMPTQYACRGRLIFERLPSIKVKGKKDVVKVFNPYPKELASMFTGTEVAEKLRKLTRATSLDTNNDDGYQRRLGARRRTIEMGSALLQTRKNRRRFKSIISIFDTFFNPEDARAEFGDTTGGGVEVTAERVERGLGGGPRRRTIPPKNGNGSMVSLDAPIVEEMPIEQLEKEIEQARADNPGPMDKDSAAENPKNLMNQLHNFQREGYMMQNTLKKQAEKHKAKQRQSGIANGSGADDGTVSKDELIVGVVAEKERRSVPGGGNGSINLPPLFGDDTDEKRNADNVSPFDETKNSDYESTIINDSKEEAYTNAPVKAIRVLLPSEKGQITVTAYDLTTVRQLKKRVMDRCRTREFVPQDAKEEEYCFLFTSTNIGLSDHLEMITIPSILATHNITNKDVVELSLVPLRVAAGNWYDSYAPSSRSGSVARTGGGDDESRRQSALSAHTMTTTAVGDNDEDDDVLAFLSEVDNDDDEYYDGGGGGGGDGDDDEREVTQVRPNIIRMFTSKSGVMMSQDDGGVLDDLIACDQSMRVCIQDLLTKQVGCTVVVEGEVGVGKSYLLSNTILSAPAKQLCMCCTVANPFDTTKKPLSVFGDLVLQLIDDGIEQGAPSRADRLTQRMNYVASTLSAALSETTSDEIPVWQQNSADNISEKTDLYVFLPVLNSLLRLEYATVPATRVMGRKACARRSMTILLALIEYVTRTRSVAFVIDDGVYMDEFSWKMCLQLNDILVPNNFMLVISTRPINRSYMAAFGRMPPEYKALTTERLSTKRLKLVPRPDEIIYQMACDALGVVQLPPLLAALVLQKSHGNPLVVKEFVYALEHNALVSVDTTTKTCLLSKVIQFMDLNELMSTVHVPVPMTLEAVLGSQIDRLNHEQQMVMKVAAVIGDEFEYELLYAASPFSVESSEAFARIVHGLLGMNIIRRVAGRKHDERRRGRRSKEIGGGKDPATINSRSGGGDDDDANDQSTVSLSEYAHVKTDAEVQKELELIMSNETPFTFTNGFMRDMLKSRLLEDQKAALRALVSQSIHKKLRDKSSVMYLSPTCRRSGTLWIHRGADNDGELVQRFLVLTDKAIVVYHDVSEYTKDPDTRKKPEYLLVLAGAKLARTDRRMGAYEHVAELCIYRWVEYQGEQRDACNFDEESFLLAHEDNNELRQWLQEIQRVVIQQMSSQRRSLMHLARKTKIWHQQRTAMGLSLMRPSTELRLETFERAEICERFWNTVIGLENNKQSGGLLMNQVYVRKRKFFLTEWKQRWITLTPDGLFIRNAQMPHFNSKQIKSRSDRLKPSFTDAVCLTTGRCEANQMGYDEDKKMHLFRIHCEVWMKKLTMYEWKERDYIIGVHSDGAAQRWVESIEKVIDFHKNTLLAAQRAKGSSISVSLNRGSGGIGGGNDAIQRAKTMR